MPPQAKQNPNRKKKGTTQHKQKMNLKQNKDYQSIRENQRFQQEFDMIWGDKLGTNINIPESYMEKMFAVYEKNRKAEENKSETTGIDGSTD
jgi:hypothetical protein